MNDIIRFFEMGGYGFYVWSSYLIALITMISFFIVSGKKLKNAIADIKRYLRRTNT